MRTYDRYGAHNPYENGEYSMGENFQVGTGDTNSNERLLSKKLNKVQND